MDTVTITLHDTDNSGSSLQAFALQYFLKQNGISNEIINYVPKYTRNNGHPIRAFIKKIIFRKEKKSNRNKYKHFRDNYLSLTSETYYSIEQLRMKPPQAKVYITGSDQLWNTMYMCGKDPAFYLDFNDQVTKISYGVSLGRKNPSNDNIEMIKKYANSFEWISLREKKSVELISNYYDQKKINYVSDPVLLNDADTYINLASPRMIHNDYILVYVAQEISKNTLNSVLKLVKEKCNNEIVFIGSYRNKCSCDIHIRDFGPEDFLSLILNSKLIISNSFHATIFSIILQKNFYTIIPKENGERIIEILDISELRDRAIENNINLKDIAISDKRKVIALNNLEKFGTKSRDILLTKLYKYL